MKNVKRKMQRRGRVSAAVAVERVDMAAAREFGAELMRGVEVTEKFGNASFSLGGKVFAFTRRDGLVLKLPEGIVERVMAEREAGLLVMGKRVMKQWVHICLDGAERYRQERELMLTALLFVFTGTVMDGGRGAKR